MKKIKFDDGSGYFNADYFLYVQQLGLPTGDNDEVSPIIDNDYANDFTGRLQKIKNLLVRKTPDKEATKDAIFERVREEAPKIWTPFAMRGAEYEGGGFNSYITYRLLDNVLSAASTTVQVNSNMLPSENTVEKLKDWDRYMREKEGHTNVNGQVLSVGERFLQAGVDIEKDAGVFTDPEASMTGYGRINVPVHIIAPSNIMSAAKDLIGRSLSSRGFEPASHRGMRFAEAAIKSVLKPEVQAQLVNPDAEPSIDDAFSQAVAWYEIKQGVFWTVNEEMFNKAKVAFGLEKPVAPAAKAKPAVA